MKDFRYLIITFLTIALLGSCTSDDDVPKETHGQLAYKALLNVSYGNDADQVYDIYLPENRTTSTKIIILIHGGGWHAGDKVDMTGFRDFLRAQLPNVAVVNINYRLADENNAPHPMQINDITSVVNDLEARQAEYQIGQELGFFGISAGAHLSLFWSYAYDSENKVNMVGSMVGATNLADDAYINNESQVVRDLIFQYGQDIEVLKSVSPLYHVKTTSPPTLLFFGGNDPLVPNSQGIDIAAKLTELNVVHEYTVYENEGHGWVGESIVDTAVKLQAFIEEHL